MSPSRTRVAQLLVDGGFAERYDYALPDARRGALRLAGAITIRRTRCGSTRCACMRPGMIESSPNQIIADGTDWRFLNELKRELKA